MSRERHCRYCGNVITASNRDILTRLFQAGLTETDAVNALPVCFSCADVKYVSPSIGKYHEDANINAVCLWCESREYDRTAVRIEDEGPTWMVRLKMVSQRFPKGSSQAWPVGSIFGRLDDLVKREKTVN